MKLFIHPLAAAQLHPEEVDDDVVGTIACNSGLDDEPQRLVWLIEQAIKSYAFPSNGQGFIPLPEEALELVLAGCAAVTPETPADAFVVRMHRGERVTVLDRHGDDRLDLRPEFVAAIVYTLAAFEVDGDTTPEEWEQVVGSGAEHVLITLIASKGPRPQPSSHRLVRNIAGGNAKYRQMLEEYEEAHGRPMTGKELLDVIEKGCKATVAYEKEWCTVG